MEEQNSIHTQHLAFFLLNPHSSIFKINKCNIYSCCSDAQHTGEKGLTNVTTHPE